VLFARQWATSSADAEDIVQEAFVRFWRSSHRAAADAHLQLFAMVRRAGLDHVRRLQRRQARELRVTEEADHVSWFARTTLENEERAEALQAALAQLPTEQREVVVLKIWGELTFEQIARTLELSPHTAASRYRYALETLRRNFTPSML